MKYTEVNGDTATIKVVGRFDLIRTAEVMQEVSAAFSSQGCTKICVDFAETTFIDSSAIRDLGKLYRKVKRDNFSAKNAADEVYSALYAMKLDTLWNLKPPMA